MVASRLAGVLASRREQPSPATAQRRPYSALLNQPGTNEVAVIDTLAKKHDASYKSVSFGEDIIREMFMVRVTSTLGFAVPHIFHPRETGSGKS